MSKSPIESPENKGFEAWIEFLGGRLKQPLPGQLAQKKMMPAASSVERFDPPQPGQFQEASVLILFIDNGGIKFPLIKRPEYAGIHSSQMGFPGGRREAFDANAATTALRETQEELNIYPEEVTMIGGITPLYIPPSNFMVQPYVAWARRIPRIIPHQREVEEVVMTDLFSDFLRQPSEESEVMVRGFRMRVPCYKVQGHVVWGATAMMLSEVEALAREFFD